MDEISLFTDGSCDGNPGPGGYAAIIKQNGTYKEIAGSVPLSTVNRMELQAVIAGLSEIKSESRVTVYTDSEYIERAFNEGRVETWQKNGWKRIRTGENVKNTDIWQTLVNLIKEKALDVTFVKTAAHKHDVHNNRADQIAKQAAKGYRKKKKLVIT